jgi:hypothetical protein
VFHSKSLGGVAPRCALAILLSAPVVLLTACGGGGGGDDGTPAANVVQLTITEANQMAVASEAVGVAQEGATVADLGASVAVGVQVDAATSVPGPVVLAAVSRKLLSMAPQVPAMATGVTQTATENCTGGGTATVTATGSGGTTAVAGDSLTIAANNCVETIDGTQFRMNGTLTMSIAAGSFDPNSLSYPKDVTLGMKAENFSMNAVALNGTLSLRMLQSSGSSGTVTLTSSAFAWRDSSGPVAHNVSLASYTHRVTRSSTGSSTTEVSGTVTTDSPQINAGLVRFDLSTPTPIASNASGVITAGSLQVTGNASTLLLTTTANDTFSLQLDKDGNGTFDTTRTVTRSQL